MMMISDLPNDLESEILSRVPAKSLWELKATCKRWYAFFRDPRFVEKNKKLGGAVRETMLLSKYMVYSIAGDLHSTVVNTPVKLTGKLTSLKGSKDLKFSHIFQCDGLMLCSNIVYNRLVVWNPCTGQRRKIKPRTRYGSDNDTYALGYITSSSGVNSYKILKYRYYGNKECEMYDVCSGSWRVLDSITLDYELYDCGISLKGDTYWVARDEASDFYLKKFDFTTERFVCLPLPIPSFFIHDDVLLSVVRDEKLALLHIDNSSGVTRIWVSNNIDKEAKDLSWRSHFVLKVDFDKFNLNVESFLLDEENKVVVCCDASVVEHEYKTKIYIVGDDMFKQVYTDTVKAPGRNWPLVITYVPSLVRIQKSTPKRGKKRRLIGP